MRRVSGCSRGSSCRGGWGGGLCGCGQHGMRNAFGVSENGQRSVSVADRHGRRGASAAGGVAGLAIGAEADAVAGLTAVAAAAAEATLARRAAGWKLRTRCYKLQCVPNIGYL
eukprot:gb/GEZJ01004775.1/.p2 GENE.gb/GEZJ01004775.1/~~gb/GEZJ01004775.1/.p2  ORF type:complete len:113 (+),score=3.19 gb/GEZJ01004775.1/:998-1336(+)